ncbi:hypothetical protein GCM10023263_73910 [Phytohabitans rumicis]
MHHNRLAALVLIANLALLGHALTGGGWWSGDRIDLAAVSAAVLANFALAILIRQQYVINLLFWLATRAPTHWPLRIRWTLGKVYHFGGLHVGGALAGTLWFVVLTASITLDTLRSAPPVSIGLLVVSYALLALLAAIVLTARPGYRARQHDRFERMHRFGGWTALVLFWTQTVLFVQTGDGSLLAAPQIWVLALLTLSVALPWLRLRKVPVAVTRPSNHVAVARFNHGVTPFAGSSTAISRHPLREWHSFANVPAPGESGFRLTISRAGDWTGSFIDDMPAHVWVKGITTAGVANIETLFTKVVYVATGSGIGPVLPHLLARKVPSRLVWATRSPRATYGDALVDEILAGQPDATVWDTATHGKPDMVRLAYAAYAAFGAEAVICISNKKLTWQVVHGLERRGIPAYGAIWDS